MRGALRGEHLNPDNPLPAPVVAMYRRYRQMVDDKALFDRLGVTREQGEDLPAEFLAWAREFDRIDREG